MWAAVYSGSAAASKKKSHLRVGFIHEPYPWQPTFWAKAPVSAPLSSLVEVPGELYFLVSAEVGGSDPGKVPGVGFLIGRIGVDVVF
jgi:hypothetical protein